MKAQLQADFEAQREEIKKQQEAKLAEHRAMLDEQKAAQEKLKEQLGKCTCDFV